MTASLVTIIIITLASKQDCSTECRTRS